VKVTVQDSYGNTVTGYAGTVHFTSSDTNPSVVLPADYTFTGADNGVHTFTGAILITAPAQTITVDDGSIIVESAEITVIPAELDHILVSPLSATITAGASQVYTAEAFDAFNNSKGDVTNATTFAISPNGSCADAT